MQYKKKRAGQRACSVGAGRVTVGEAGRSVSGKRNGYPATRTVPSLSIGTSKVSITCGDARGEKQWCAAEGGRAGSGAVSEVTHAAVLQYLPAHDGGASSLAKVVLLACITHATILCSASPVRSIPHGRLSAPSHGHRHGRAQLPDVRANLRLSLHATCRCIYPATFLTNLPFSM
jgi:hypothetical protein